MNKHLRLALVALATFAVIGLFSFGGEDDYAGYGYEADPYGDAAYGDAGSSYGSAPVYGESAYGPAGNGGGYPAQPAAQAGPMPAGAGPLPPVGQGGSFGSDGAFGQAAAPDGFTPSARTALSARPPIPPTGSRATSSRPNRPSAS